MLCRRLESLQHSGRRAYGAKGFRKDKRNRKKRALRSRKTTMCLGVSVNFNLIGKMVFFATGNIHKFNEALLVLAQHGLAARMLLVKSVEIQSDSLAEIAAASAMDAYKRCHLPLFVEDAGLFVDALKGFP